MKKDSDIVFNLKYDKFTYINLNNLLMKLHQFNFLQKQINEVKSSYKNISFKISSLSIIIFHYNITIYITIRIADILYIGILPINYYFFTKTSKSFSISIWI